MILGYLVEEGQINNRIFSKWLFGWCKDKKRIKNLCFTGSRIEAFESPVYKGREAL